MRAFLGGAALGGKEIGGEGDPEQDQDNRKQKEKDSEDRYERRRWALAFLLDLVEVLGFRLDLSDRVGEPDPGQCCHRYAAMARSMRRRPLRMS
jgi:hypothetical protein